MTVPDGIIMGAIGSLAAYAAWFSKRIADSYFADVKAAKETLEKVKNGVDGQSKVHEKQCQALDRIIVTLNKINGGVK